MNFSKYFNKEITAYLEKRIDELSDKYEVSPNVLEDILIGEARPVDAKSWPRTWLKGKRPVNFFNGLEEIYMKGFGSCYPSNVKKVVDQWNTYAAMRVDRLKRIFEKEKSFRIKKVYIRSKNLKDMYVILYMLKTRKGAGLRDMIRQTIRLIKDPKSHFTPRIVWKWNTYGTDVVVKNSHQIGSKVKTIDAGSDEY